MTLNFFVTFLPAKERSGRDGGFDDDKFAGPWRREGPPPATNDRGGFRSGPSKFDDERGGFGSRFGSGADGPGRGGPSREAPESTEAESNSDWRASARPVRAPPTPLGGGDRPGPPSRKTSGFPSQEGPHAADTDSVWQRGTKFSPSEPEKTTFRASADKGNFFARRDSSMKTNEDEPSDWRSAPRKQPPTPQQNNGRQSNERSREFACL